FNAFVTIVEDPLDVATHYERVSQLAHDPKRKAIAYEVRHLSPIAVGLKAMGVMPHLVRARSLHIGKPDRRIPKNNLRCPVNREPAHPQAITNLGAFSDRIRLDGENFEVHPWRSNRLKVIRIREKSEDFFDGTRDPLLSSQRMEPHLSAAKDAG